MENNLESDVKYVLYKDTNPCRLNKKRIDKKPLNDGIIRNCQKKKEDLRQKAREYHKNRCHNLMVEVK